MEGGTKDLAIKAGDIIPAPDFEVIPDELKEQPHWLLWQARPIMDKPEEATKIPVTIDGKVFKGWNNPNNLYSFEEVEEAYLNGDFTGIGFALAGTDFICIDLDNDESTDHISDELQELITYGYTEVSPSGKGYHIWIKGRKPTGMGKIGYTTTGEKLEVFGGSGWVTVTGRLDWPFPRPIKTNQALINRLNNNYFKEKDNYKKSVKLSTQSFKQNLEKIKEAMFNSDKGQKIIALWNGDTSLYGGDHSSADFALCRYLAYYAKGDSIAIDSLFRQSGLYREKWDERRGNTTYGGLTISKILKDYKSDASTFTFPFERNSIDPGISEGIFLSEDYEEQGNSQREIMNSMRKINDILLEHSKVLEDLSISFEKRLEKQHEYIDKQLGRILIRENDLSNLLGQVLEENRQLKLQLQTELEEKNTDFFNRLFWKKKRKRK